MLKFVWLALAGALGTLLRAGLSSFVQKAVGLAFPWGTVVVNVVGCFCFGLAWTVLEERVQAAPEVRLVVLTGFMGAFTTFSTYVFDTGMLGEQGRIGAAVGNLALQNGVGLVCLFAGIALARAI